LNKALDKKYKYVVGELNCGDSHNTDPRSWLQRFKDKHYQIVSFVLVGGKQVRLQRCKNDPKLSPFDKIDESFFNHDSEIFDRHDQDRIFYKKSGLREITLNRATSSANNEFKYNMNQRDFIAQKSKE
jgi:hypothetical protein